MDYNEAAMRLHREHRGKIELAAKVPVRDRDALSTAYTPGVAEPCREIARRPEAAWELTALAERPRAEREPPGATRPSTFRSSTTAPGRR